MKTNSQDNVRSQFNLPPNERIHDDFGCSLSEIISYHGRLYLTENYLCFHSHIIKEIKIIISLHEIKEVQHSKTAVTILTTDNSKPKVIFVSFSNLSLAYKRIKLICKAYLKRIAIQSTGRASLNSSQMIFGRGSLNMSMSSITLPNNGSEAVMVLSESDEQLDDQDEENKSIAGSQQSHRIEERKSSQVSAADSQKNSSECLENEEFVFPTINSEYYEACKVVIDKPAMVFFEKYFKNQPDTSYSAFYATQDDHSNVVVSDWEKKEDSEKETYEKRWTFTVKLKGVPMIDQSNIVKVQVYTVDSEKNPIVIKGSSSSLNAPFCDCFSIEDMIEIFPYMNNTKSIVRASVMSSFSKFTLMKFPIIMASKKEYQKEMDNWLEFIKNSGDKVEKYVPPPPMAKRRSLSLPKNSELKLLHGVENISNITNQKRRIRMSESLKSLVIYGLLALLIIAVILILINQRNHSHMLREQNALLTQLLHRYSHPSPSSHCLTYPFK